MKRAGRCGKIREGARPDPRDEPLGLFLLHEPRPASLGEPLERAREDEAGASDEIALTQHDVGGKVFGSPVVEQCGYVSPEFFEKIAQCKALVRAKRKTLHIPIPYVAGEALADEVRDERVEAAEQHRHQDDLAPCQPWIGLDRVGHDLPWRSR